MADKKSDEMADIDRLHRWIDAVGGNISPRKKHTEICQGVEGRWRAHHRAQQKKQKKTNKKTDRI